MVNKHRLRGALDALQSQMETLMRGLETTIHDLDEETPTSVVFSDDRDDLRAANDRIHDLEQEIRDVQRSHKEQMDAVASDDSARFRQIIERRENELQVERANVERLTLQLSHSTARVDETVSRFDRVSRELDDLKHKRLPALIATSGDKDQKIASYTNTLDFYAAGGTDEGRRAKRALGRDVKGKEFAAYTKPS